MNAIEWVLRKIKPLVDTLVRGAKKAVAGVKGAVRVVAGWLGLRKRFTTDDGETHTLYFEGNEQRASLMMSSKPDSVQQHINRRRRTQPYPTPTQRKSLTAAETTLLQIHRLMRPGGQPAAETKSVATQIGNLLDTLSAQLVAGGVSVDLPLSKVTYTTHATMKAYEVKADPLSARAGNTKGSGTGSSDPPGWKYKETKAIADPSGYVRMHLLYHLLHGPGVAWNLAPAPQTFNIGFMQPNIEIPLKDATDAGAVFRFTVSVKYPNEGEPIDEFPNALSATWSALRTPQGVTIPKPPRSTSIPPPTFTGAGILVLPDLSKTGRQNLFEKTDLAQDLCRAIANARGGGTFANASDFKKRVNDSLQTIFNGTRSYTYYEKELIALRSRFVLNGKPMTKKDLKWP